MQPITTLSLVVTTAFAFASSVYRSGEKRELHVDPENGEITKDEKDD